jgi:PspA-Associated protein
VIVRLMGEGQFRVDDEDVAQLNEIDDAVVQAVEAGDEAELRRRLEELVQSVREVGERLDDAHLGASDLVVPPADLDLAEARELFSGEGLIPDLPAD